MNTLELAQIKQRVLQVGELIRTQEALLMTQPGNFAQRLALDSLRAQLPISVPATVPQISQ